MRAPDLVLQTLDLSAQRGLRRVNAALGGDCDSALLGDRDEITKMSQLHSTLVPERYDP